MAERRCKWCGDTFTTPETVKGNNMKYCSQKCRLNGYKQVRKDAKKRYYEKTHGTNYKRCSWCGKQFISRKNRKYCCIEHKKLARQEQSRRSSIKYNLKELSEKQKYFKYLGNSNLREHKKENFEDEHLLVLHEKRRLGL